MPVNFDTFRDTSGNAAYGPRFSIDMGGVLLATNVAQPFVIPGYATLGGAPAPSSVRFWECIFSIQPGSNVFVAYTPPKPDGLPNPSPVAATAYTGTMSAVTSDYLPKARFVDAGGTISVLTPDDSAYVGLILWTMPMLSQ